MFGSPLARNGYTDSGVQLQQAVFGYFLKGEEMDWEFRPSVQVHIRHVDATAGVCSDVRWPLSNTTHALGDGPDFLKAQLSALSS